MRADGQMDIHVEANKTHSLIHSCQISFRTVYKKAQLLHTKFQNGGGIGEDSVQETADLDS
jgi:hypothetical protein